MNITIQHNLSWFEGGTEIDEIIRSFANKLSLEEGNYSLYQPCNQYLLYKNATMGQFKSIKKRLKNSKRLKDIGLEVIANDVK